MTARDTARLWQPPPAVLRSWDPAGPKRTSPAVPWWRPRARRMAVRATA